MSKIEDELSVGSVLSRAKSIKLFKYNIYIGGDLLLLFLKVYKFIYIFFFVGNGMRLEERFFVKYFEEKNKKIEALGEEGKKKKKQTEEEEEDEIDEFCDDLFEARMEDNDIDEDDDIDGEELDYSYDSQEFGGDMEDEEMGEGEIPEAGDEEYDEGDDAEEGEGEEELDFESKKKMYEDEFGIKYYSYILIYQNICLY